VLPDVPPCLVLCRVDDGHPERFHGAPVVNPM
jgi:hypothetical protein